MNIMQITSVSTKGQVVIPGEIRQELGIKAGTKLMVFSDGTNLLMKPIAAPDKKEFSRLIGESGKFVAKSGLRRSDVRNIIRKTRLEGGR